MYSKILVAVENSPRDRRVIDHVEQLATLTGAVVVLVHVADGWAARYFNELKLRESEEMIGDRAYLERLRQELQAHGLTVDTRLGLGDPATEICRVAAEEQVDLIAMGTHGHRGVSDVLHGETVDHVRHRVRIPVLLVRTEKPAAE
jgi:nucleotide-binding universal stress UspA family protein